MTNTDSTTKLSALPDDLRALREAMYDVGYHSPAHALADALGKRAANERATAAESRILSTVAALTEERDALRTVASLADFYLDGTRKHFNAAWLYDTRKKLEAALAALSTLTPVSRAGAGSCLREVHVI